MHVISSVYVSKPYMKRKVHWHHKYGFSALINITSEKWVLNSWQAYDFSPVRIIMCPFNKCFENGDPNRLHRNKGSPKCLSACGFSVIWKCRSTHFTEKNIFSSVCVQLWFWKCEFCGNAYLHTSQEHDLSPACVCLCIFKDDFVENLHPHKSQE